MGDRRSNGRESMVSSMVFLGGATMARALTCARPSMMVLRVQACFMIDCLCLKCIQRQLGGIGI